MRFPFILVLFIFFNGQVSAYIQSRNQYVGDSLHGDFGVNKSISIDPDIFLSPLSPIINENSGLIFWRNKLWTHNDSGGHPGIYAIDTSSGKVVQTIILKNAANIDWEDITQDEEFIYVGDFGNNRGNRTNLRIYKIGKNKIPLEGDAKIDHQGVITFSYSDQHDFSKRMNKHDFDCESMASFNDELILFSKNWKNQKTRVYHLPKESGTYLVDPYAEFDVEGLITGAAFSADQSHLVLIGYVDYESFMWLFWDYQGADFFGGKKLRIKFPELIFVQTEGICFTQDDQVLISCEESSEFPSLYQVQTELLKAMALSGGQIFVSDDIVLSGMPPRVSGKIKVDILKLPNPEFSVELRNTRWVKLFEENAVMKNKQKKFGLTVKVRDLDNGLYFLKISSGEHSLIKKVRIVN
jgi:hypothetical protein